MKVYIQLKEEGSVYFLKSFSKDQEQYKLVWDTEKKLAYNFKSMDNVDFQIILEYMAENHHMANVTYAYKK